MTQEAINAAKLVPPLIVSPMCVCVCLKMKYYLPSDHRGHSKSLYVLSIIRNPAGNIHVTVCPFVIGQTTPMSASTNISTLFPQGCRISQPASPKGFHISQTARLVENYLEKSVE